MGKIRRMGQRSAAEACFYRGQAGAKKIKTFTLITLFFLERLRRRLFGRKGSFSQSVDFVLEQFDLCVVSFFKQFDSLIALINIICDENPMAMVAVAVAAAESERDIAGAPGEIDLGWIDRHRA